MFVRVQACNPMHARGLAFVFNRRLEIILFPVLSSDWNE